MRRLLNPTAALITFFIGISVTALWLIAQRRDIPAPEAQSLSLSVVTAPQTDPETEKYAVYSALINDMYVANGGKLLVIEQATDCKPSTDDKKVEEERRWTEDYAARELKGLKRETVDDFEAKMKVCPSITKRLDIPLKYVLVTDKEIASVFKGEGDGWRRFYANYPGSSGVVSFSNVGFDRDMTQAFVSTARSCGGLCGAGYEVLLEKEGGVWKVRSKVMTWVS